MTLPSAASGAERSDRRALAGRVGQFGQRCLRRSLGLGLALYGAPQVRVDVPEFVDAQFDAVARADRADRSGWGVSRDVETLRWERSMGRLEIYTPAESPDRFAIVACSEHKRELLVWHLGADRREGLAVLNAIAARCERDGARMRLDTATLDQSGGSARLWTRLAGLVRRRWQEKMYVKAIDSRCWSEESLEFDLLFNL